MPLTSYENLSKENIVFYPPKEFQVKESKFKSSSYQNRNQIPNWKKRSFINWDSVFVSFGVNEKKSQETDKLVGYSIPICLWENLVSQTRMKKPFLKQ